MTLTVDPVSLILLLCFECVEDAADQRFSSLTEYWDHLGLKPSKPGIDSWVSDSD